MRALREGVVPPWLLVKPPQKRPARVRKAKPRPIIVTTLRVAAALHEGETISARTLQAEFDLPWSTAKRLMHDIREAYGDELEAVILPRTGRGGTHTQAVRLKAKA